MFTVLKFAPRNLLLATCIVSIKSFLYIIVEMIVHCNSHSGEWMDIVLITTKVDVILVVQITATTY